MILVVTGPARHRRPRAMTLFGGIEASSALFAGFLRRSKDILCISRGGGNCMQVQVARWGNSLGLRIPKDIARQAGLREGARVDVEAQGDRIIISPAGPRYVLAELLGAITPEANRAAFDWRPGPGR